MQMEIGFSYNHDVVCGRFPGQIKVLHRYVGRLWTREPDEERGGDLVSNMRLQRELGLSMTASR